MNIIKNTAILLLCFLFLSCFVEAQQQELFLYDVIPNEKQGDIRERVEYGNNMSIKYVSGVRNPRLLVFFPENPNGLGIIYCPGGGYKKLNIENAGFIAERLNKRGITVFVLIYRLPSIEIMEDPAIGSLQDVQSALRLVRKQGSQWKLNKIGLWGSSAGGHLAAMAATRHSFSFEQGRSNAGLRPDFLILSWPVVSFRPGLVHAGCRNVLLGEQPSKEQIFDYSAENQVNKNTPPTFLIHANDDKTVISDNSLVFYSALKKENVPAELHIFENGGHGFGLSPETESSWMELLYDWLEKR